MANYFTSKMTKATQLELDQKDVSISVLLQQLAVPSTKITVTRKKDLAAPAATLPSGARVSGPAAIAKLVLSTAGVHAEWLGVTDAEKAAVEKQIDAALALHKTLSGAGSDAALKELDAALVTKVFIVGNHVSIADFFMYAALYTSVAKASKQTRSDLCNVTRYFNLIQHVVHDGSRVTLTDVVDIELDVPCEDVAILAEAKAGGAGAPAAGANAKKPAAEKKGKEEKKAAVASGDSKKEAKKDGKGAASPVAAPKAAKEAKAAKSEAKVEKVEAAEENLKAEPERLDLRVGLITKVEKHPQADSLFVEEVDLGEDKPRTVVSGLVKYMKAEDMQNRLVVLLCNLKPAKMRGVDSQAMVLAATSADGSTVELLDAPAGSKPGDRCWFDTYKGTDFSQLNAKKKTWETVQPRLKTDGAKRAVYSVAEAGVTFNSILRNDHGDVTVKSVAGASIK
ncbi:hypothetical protein HDU80_010629 [Chytriomyces hyalinus]|nr:hypothetical protein HDU80_010629 [Chytriomyces hyalinus]